MMDPETRLEVSDTNGSHPDKVDAEIDRIFRETPVRQEEVTPPDNDGVKYDFGF